MTETKNLIPAEIVLTAIEGKVYAFVNGEQITETAERGQFLGRIEKSLRANHIYRQTEYVTEAGALIAEGQAVTAA